MNPKRWQWVRRTSQVLFLLAFSWLVLQTNFDPQLDPANPREIELPLAVSIFLEMDPLAMIITLLATGAVAAGLVWSLAILVPAFFFGRFFCGWVCPLGTLNQLASRRKIKAPKGKPHPNGFSSSSRIKYLVLLAFLAAGVAGSAAVGLLDPLSLFARSLGTVVLPGIHTAAQALRDAAAGIGLPIIAQGADAALEGMGGWLLPLRQVSFQGIVLLAVVFTAVLAANRFRTRFWCRTLCPLGALLGLSSRYSLLTLEKTDSRCTDCGLCQSSCQGGDDPIPGKAWRRSECHLCLNCTEACPTGALRFKLGLQDAGLTRTPDTRVADLGRRRVLVSAGAGLASMSVLRSSALIQKNRSPLAIRPPGSVAEEKFLARCIRCGQCMRVCPNNALHPMLLEVGVEGLWTPMLIPKLGYCEPTCTLCGQVCPTDAILQLSVAEKTGKDTGAPVRIGTAFFDRGRCLPWAMDRPCIVCEEWCPTTPKAITTEKVLVEKPGGAQVLLQRPRVEPAHCTGCGACEFACPINDLRAVRVTSVGESRSYENQFLS